MNDITKSIIDRIVLCCNVDNCTDLYVDCPYLRASLMNE